jgi:hypothetical protein
VKILKQVELTVPAVVIDKPPATIKTCICDMQHDGRQVELYSTLARDWVWIECPGYQPVMVDVSKLVEVLAAAMPKGGRI